MPMARLIKIEEKRPVPLKVGEETKWVCMCGLSQKKPYCDGSHHKTADEEEGKLYSYDGGERKEL